MALQHIYTSEHQQFSTNFLFKNEVFFSLSLDTCSMRNSWWGHVLAPGKKGCVLTYQLKPTYQTLELGYLGEGWQQQAGPGIIEMIISSLLSFGQS